MNFIEDPYTIPRVLLSYAAVWPCEKTIGTVLKQILISLLLLSGIVIQVNAFVTYQFSMDLFLNIMSYTLLKILYLTKYITTVIRKKSVKQVLEIIELDYEEITDEVEQEIMCKCINKGKSFAVVFAMICYIPLTAFLLFPLLPNVLDIVAPLNESRSHKIPFIAEYFVNEEKFIYLIILHICCVDLVGATVVIATEWTSLLLIHHNAGLFEIASARIQYALRDNQDKKIDPNIQRNNMVAAIDYHRKAIELIELLSAGFSTSYFIQLSIGVASLTINLYRTIQVLRFREEIEELFIRPSFVVCHLVYFFVGNMVGQKITDYGNDFFTKAYDTYWYNASRKTKRLLLFLLRRNMKQVALKMGGIFILSLEGFSTITSMCLSYFMFIYSTAKV